MSCGTGGATVLMVYKMVVGGTWSLSQIINGCLAGTVDTHTHHEIRRVLESTQQLGMVCVCSGCDFYHPLTAAMLGSIAGMLYLFTSALMVKLRYWDYKH